MRKKLVFFVLAVVICVFCFVPASATETDSEIEFVIYPQESYLPYGGSESFHTEYSSNSIDYPTNEAVTTATYIAYYTLDYTKQSMQYGTWRNGVSGGSDIADITLSFDKGYDASYNINFTATVTGSYTTKNQKTIGAELGVELGETKSYSLGSGVSVTVPAGKHYLIKYRPVYYQYKVVETQYKEAFLPGYGWHRILVGTNTCYVDVFSHWDFTVVNSPSSGMPSR